jgi:hypothetical protein
VEALAKALVANGLPRGNPFKPLVFAAPSTLSRMGYAAEAREAQRLVKAVQAHKESSAQTLAAAKALLAAAQAVEKALQPMERPLQTLYWGPAPCQERVHGQGRFYS